jgi:hypothetical protein
LPVFTSAPKNHANESKIDSRENLQLLASVLVRMKALAYYHARGAELVSGVRSDGA